MPCVYTETPQERAASKQERKMKLKNELDKVTRLLCWVMEKVDDYNVLEAADVLPDNKELEDWHLDHKNRDAKRLQAVKEAAKKKLTKEELKALGIE